MAERVWQELARGLMEAQPSRMIRVLRDCGALAQLLPELERLLGVPQPALHHPEIDTGEHVLMVIDHAAATAQPLSVRWACLLHDLGKGDTPADILPHHYGHELASARRAREVSMRLKAPTECRELAEMVAREHGVFGKAAELRPETMVKVMERCDALRRPQRFVARAHPRPLMASVLEAASNPRFVRWAFTRYRDICPPLVTPPRAR